MRIPVTSDSEIWIFPLAFRPLPHSAASVPSYLIRPSIDTKSITTLLQLPPSTVSFNTSLLDNWSTSREFVPEVVSHWPPMQPVYPESASLICQPCFVAVQSCLCILFIFRSIGKTLPSSHTYHVSQICSVTGSIQSMAEPWSSTMSTTIVHRLLDHTRRILFRMSIVTLSMPNFSLTRFQLYHFLLRSTSKNRPRQQATPNPVLDSCLRNAQYPSSILHPHSPLQACVISVFPFPPTLLVYLLYQSSQYEGAFMPAVGLSHVPLHPTSTWSGSTNATNSNLYP